ncbi:MAG: FliO/MopB family protein [Planctomycetes bacterium]|nr:FliO/MopB family protein [Planctomycetota bacterium]
MARSNSRCWWWAIGVSAILLFGADGPSWAGEDPSSGRVEDTGDLPQPVSASNQAIDLHNLPDVIDVLDSAVESSPETDGPPLVHFLDHSPARGQILPPSSGDVGEDAQDKTPIRRQGRLGAAGREMPWYRGPVASLAAVLVLIVGAAVALRRMSGRNPIRKNSVINVLSRTPVGVKQELALVHVGRRMLLLGICGDRMTPLCDIDDPAEVAHIRGQLARTGQGSSQESFERALAEETGRHRDVPMEEQKPSAQHAGHARRAQHHLRNLVEKLQTRHRSVSPTDSAAAREVPTAQAKTER